MSKINEEALKEFGADEEITRLSKLAGVKPAGFYRGYELETAEAGSFHDGFAYQARAYGTSEAGLNGKQINSSWEETREMAIADVKSKIDRK